MNSGAQTKDRGRHRTPRLVHGAQIVLLNDRLLNDKLHIGWYLTTGDVTQDGGMTTDGRWSLQDTHDPDGGNLAYAKPY